MRIIIDITVEELIHLKNTKQIAPKGTAENRIPLEQVILAKTRRHCLRQH